MPTQAPVFVPFYDIFVTLKFLFSKNIDNVIACDLQFGLPSKSKTLATPMYLVNFFFFLNFNRIWLKNNDS